RDPAKRQRLAEVRMRFGLSAAPDAAAALLHGLDTLEVRVRRQAETAAELARRLSEHPAVIRVRYPGVGGLVSFDVADDAVRRVETGTELIANMTSLGGRPDPARAAAAVGRARGRRGALARPGRSAPAHLLLERAGEGTRTPGPRFTRALLYQLSYSGARSLQHSAGVLVGEDLPLHPLEGVVDRLRVAAEDLG